MVEKASHQAGSSQNFETEPLQLWLTRDGTLAHLDSKLPGDNGKAHHDVAVLETTFLKTAWLNTVLIWEHLGREATFAYDLDIVPSSPGGLFPTSFLSIG